MLNTTLGFCEVAEVPCTYVTVFGENDHAHDVGKLTVESVNVTTVLLLYKPLSTSFVFGPKATTGLDGAKMVIVSRTISVHGEPEIVAVTTSGPGVLIAPLVAKTDVPVNGEDHAIELVVVAGTTKPGFSIPRFVGSALVERVHAKPFAIEF